MVAALVIEIVLTFGFVTVILGATDDKRSHPAAAGLARLVIGIAISSVLRLLYNFRATRS